jgi:hypothetical protein
VDFYLKKPGSLKQVQQRFWLTEREASLIESTSLWVKRGGSIPEEAYQLHLACIIPYVGRNCSSFSHSPDHLLERLLRLSYEIEHEPRDDRIRGGGGDRECGRISQKKLGARVLDTLSCVCQIAFRRIYSPHHPGRCQLKDGLAERPCPTANI